MRQHWLIWDGECGFCRRWVEWVLARDRRGVIRAAPYQSCPSPPMRPEWLPLCEKAVQVITAGGERLSGGRAVLFLLAEVGWHPRLALWCLRPPFVWVVAGVYRLVARNRRFFSRVAPPRNPS